MMVEIFIDCGRYSEWCRSVADQPVQISIKCQNITLLYPLLLLHCILCFHLRRCDLFCLGTALNSTIWCYTLNICIRFLSLLAQTNVLIRKFGVAWSLIWCVFHESMLCQNCFLLKARIFIGMCHCALLLMFGYFVSGFVCHCWHKLMS